MSKISLQSSEGGGGGGGGYELMASRHLVADTVVMTQFGF